MRHIFLDTNIYLEFYQFGTHALAQLLPALDGLREQIFSTEQIRAEVNRNKLGIAISSSQEILKRVKSSNSGLPKPVADAYEKKFDIPWKHTALSPPESGNLCELLEMSVASVAASTDDVSVVLAKIFATARSASANELALARLRKECGNPPGKRDDPLGDQLTWEQFCANTSKETLIKFSIFHRCSG